MNREKKVEAILAIVVGFLTLYFIFGVWKEFQVDWMLWTSLVVGVLSMMSDTVMSLITSVWFKFAEILGNYVTGPILLGLKKPVHVVQLGSTTREIVNMIAIAVVDAQMNK